MTSTKRLHPEDRNSVRIPVNEMIELPLGMRRVDIDNLDNEENDILLDLKMHGRRDRQYYVRTCVDLSVIKRLKSRGFIVSIKLAGHYAYDLSPSALLLMKHGLVG